MQTFKNNSTKHHRKTATEKLSIHIKMKKTLITIMSVSLLAACGPKKGELTSGIYLDNLDTQANPVEDFYQYACGGWMANNPLDPEHARFGTFDKLAEDNRDQMRNLIDSIVTANNATGSLAEKIAMFYNVGMDSTTLQKQGAAPIQPLLNEIASIKDREGAYQEMIALHRQGIDPYFGIFGEADFDDASMTIGWVYQTGLGMGDRDEYLKTDEVSAKHREGYLNLMSAEFALAGYDKISGLPAEALAQMVMKLETRLAKAHYDKLTNRDPYKTFHKMTTDEANAVAPNIRFNEYFPAMGVENVGKFNVAQPEYMTEVSKVLAEENLESIKAYYAWNVINTAASYLSDDFVTANFEYFGRLVSGQQQQRPRWKRVTNALNGAMGEAIGQMYVAKYFPKEAKDRMVTLINNLQEAFGERIKQATWMDQATKDAALQKLGAIYVKVGYPDKWRDYSKLEVSNDSYFANILRSNRFDVDYMLSKINKPTDRDEWQMTPQTVNAYYNPTTNEICFPAGILQPPFFDLHADDAANYGAIGVVIGHEMTHGFDDQGRQYDKDGNLSDWWQPSDAENFKANAKVLADHFSAIKVLDDPETYANGELTLGENIADNGGIHLAFLAMQKAMERKQVNKEEMDGFTPEQRFFLAYANVWASNITTEQIIFLTNNDVHSLGRWRVNATLPNITEFIETWNVKEGNGMWLAPEKRAKLW